MNRFKFVGILSGCILIFQMFSCTTIEKLKIEVANLPENKVPDQVQTLLLLNGALTGDFANYNTDSLEVNFLNESLVLDNTFLGSIAADTALTTLGNALFFFFWFDVIIPVERNIDNSGLNPSVSRRLSPEDIKILCQQYDADAILILNKFNQHFKSGLKILRSTDVESASNGSAFFECSVDLGYETEWFLLAADDRNLDRQYRQKDTISWLVGHYDAQLMYESLPLVKETLVSGGIEMGESLAKRIAPVWTEETRVYFLTGNKEADSAVAFIQNNQWAEANEILLKSSKLTASSVRSRVEFNLALTEEMLGHFDKAIEWCSKSYQSKYHKETERYLGILKNRSERINAKN